VVVAVVDHPTAMMTVTQKVQAVRVTPIMKTIALQQHRVPLTGSLQDTPILTNRLVVALVGLAHLHLVEVVVALLLPEVVATVNHSMVVLEVVVAAVGRIH